MEGNRLKMREAIESAIGLCIDAIEGGEYMGEGPDPAFEKIKKVLSAAVAAPARQCDVGTAEEQRVRFESFCKRKGDGFSASAYCAYECPCGNKGDCKLAWAQTPYAEEGAGK